MLAELGELSGQAIDAVENCQLLSAETFVAVELEGDDRDAALAAIITPIECRIELAGIVPSAEVDSVSYLRVGGAAVHRVRDESW